MPVSSKSNLPLLKRLDVILGLFQALTKALLGGFGALIFGRMGAPTLKEYFRALFSRYITSRLNIHQLNYATPSSETSYLSFTKARGLTPITATLPDGTTKTYWVGDREAENLILFFHGGAYALPASFGHFDFSHKIANYLTTANNPTSVLVLDYTLTTVAKYPTQLQQSVELVRWAMSATTKPPSKIILAGDSAGASLALGVLSHVTHKHPEIEPLELPEPFRAAVLASPWVDFDNRGQSYHKYAERDPMTTSTLKRWSADYLGGAKKDYYNEPGKAPVEWWQDLPVKDVLVVGGACEMMEDDIKSLGERLKKAGVPAETFMGPDEFHAQTTFGRDFGLAESQQTQKVKEWLVERLK